MNTKRLIVISIIALLAFGCNQKDSNYYIKQGNSFYNNKEYESATRNYTLAIDIDKNNITAYYKRADTYRRMFKYDLALIDYTSVIKFNSKVPNNAYTKRGATYFALGEFDKAILDLRIAIKESPQDVEPYYELAKVYYEQDKIDSAFQNLNIVLQLDSLYNLAYLLRGQIFMYKQQYQLAINDYDIAIKLQPNNNSFIHFLRGGCYVLLSNGELALQDYNEAIKLKPDKGILYLARAGVYKTFFNDTEKAIIDLKKAAALGNEEAIEELKKYKND